MAETSVQVNIPSTLGQRLKTYSSTDGEGHVVQSEAVTLTTGAGVELVNLRSATGGAPVGVTVSTSAVPVLGANADARSRVISNNGSTNIFIGVDGTVTASGATMGIKLLPGGVYNDAGAGIYLGDLYAIGDDVSADENVSVWERL